MGGCCDTQRGHARKRGETHEKATGGRARQNVRECVSEQPYRNKRKSLETTQIADVSYLFCTVWPGGVRASWDRMHAQGSALRNERPHGWSVPFARALAHTHPKKGCENVEGVRHKTALGKSMETLSPWHVCAHVMSMYTVSHPVLVPSLANDNTRY
eukprot:452675-Rhodomonas_salina.1